MEQRQAREQDRKMAVESWTLLALPPLAIFWLSVSESRDSSEQNRQVACASCMILAGVGSLVLALKCLSKALAAALART